jgi:hypothetical protein
MKLRIRGQSLRLRLAQPDLATLQAHGRIDDAVVFGPGSGQQFAYGIVLSPRAEATDLRYEPGRLTVVLPQAQATAWAYADATTLEASLPVAGQRDLKLVIEKDFACRAPRAAEEDAGAFANPLPGHTC